MSQDEKPGELSQPGERPYWMYGLGVTEAKQQRADAFTGERERRLGYGGRQKPRVSLGHP